MDLQSSTGGPSISPLTWGNWLVSLLIVVYAQINLSWYESKVHRGGIVFRLIVFFASVFMMGIPLGIPMEVAVVSSAKFANGSATDWASNATIVNQFETEMDDLYYVTYSICLMVVFVVLPFAYFYFEDQSDPVLESTTFYRIRRAFLYMLVFPALFALLLTIGAVIPMRTHPSNGTDIDLSGGTEESRGRNAFAFAFSSVSAFGVCVMTVYLGLGMSAFPLSLIRGYASAAKERRRMQEREAYLKAQISVLKARIQMNNASQSDYDDLARLEHEEAETVRHERFLSEYQDTFSYQARRLVRPFQIFIGILGLAMSVLVVVSLLLSNVDKVSNAEPTTGYVLNYTSIPNPMDYVLLQLEKASPLEAFFFTALVFYLIVCCTHSIQRFGLWCCCFKIHPIRKGKTLPQALIMMCGITSLCSFGLNILMLALSPQYVQFGSQHYVSNGTVRPCDFEAPSGECIQTRASALLMKFNYKMAVFGFGYYWLSWLFILVTVSGYFVFQFKKKVSAALQRDEDEEDVDLVD